MSDETATSKLQTPVNVAETSVTENAVFVGAAANALDASTPATAKAEQRIATFRMAAPFAPLVPLGDRPSFPPSHKGVKAILSCLLPLGGSVLPARVQGQAYRVINATLGVVTGTEGPPGGKQPFRYGMVCQTTSRRIKGQWCSIPLQRRQR
jgi:hypothetical protein